jgi:hypothetical protein
MKDLETQEAASNQRALDLERQATVLVQKEADLANEKAQTYSDLYHSLIKKRSFGCVMKKIFTLGIAACK